MKNFNPEDIALAKMRKSLPRLPSAYLDDEQDALLTCVSAHYPTKKDAIIEGLKLLEKKHQKAIK